MRVFLAGASGVMHQILPNERTRATEGVAPGRAKPRSMSEHQASRTLLKSPPELWAECSDAQSLARHLEEWGTVQAIERLNLDGLLALWHPQSGN